MSRDVTKNASNLIELPSAAAAALDGANQTTWLMWVWADTIAAGSPNNFLFNCPNPGSDAIGAAALLTTSVMQMRGCAQGGDVTQTFGTTVAATGSWAQYGGCFDWANDEMDAVSNGARATSAEAWTATAFDAGVNIGPFRLGSDSHTPMATADQLDGQIAWACFWNNVRFTDAEWAALGKGVNPLTIRPKNLVLCYPLWGKHSPEIELIRGANATLVGSIPALANMPPVIPYQILKPTIFLSASTPAVSGDGDLTLPALTCAGEATFAWSGDGALTLPALTASGTGATGERGDGALTLPALTSAGEATFGWVGDGDLAIPGLTASGVGSTGIVGDGDCTLPALVCAGVQPGIGEEGVLQRRIGGFGAGFG